MDGTFVITGGEGTEEKRVVLYSYPLGYVDIFPDLREGRQRHSFTHVYMEGKIVGDFP